MDRVTARHDSYRELVRTGVRCGRLTALDGLRSRWQLQCFMEPSITRDDAKEAVKAYCRDQWEAFDFSFYTKPGTKTGEFWVKFASWAL